MKFKKNKINILLILSIFVFAISISGHIFSRYKVTQAASGPLSGRILMVFRTPEPVPAGLCVGYPCACSVTYTTITLPYFGLAPVLCPPLNNVSDDGLPITPASAGQEYMGIWVSTEPMAVPTIWGLTY